MKEIVSLRQGINVPTITEKLSKDGYIYPGNRSYKLIDSESISKYKQTFSGNVYHTFDQLWDAAKHGLITNVILGRTAFRNRRKIQICAYWSYHVDIVLIEGKHDKCFPVSTYCKCDRVTNKLGINDIADLLTADEFIEYCLERGMNTYALSKK